MEGEARGGGGGGGGGIKENGSLSCFNYAVDGIKGEDGSLASRRGTRAPPVDFWDAIQKRMCSDGQRTGFYSEIAVLISFAMVGDGVHALARKVGNCCGGLAKMISAWVPVQ